MEAQPQQEGKSQRTRRLNDELHAFVRQRNLKACLAALAQGEKDKNVDGRSYATACAACGDAGDGAIAASRGAAAPSRHRCASSPGEQVVGGLVFDFGAVRTESRDHDAPHRSDGPAVITDRR
jgi:hypothetical protein